MLFPDLKHKGNKQILQRSIWCVLNTHTLYVYIHMYAHSRMDIHIFSRAHVYMNAFMHTHERCMCAYHKHTYTHVCIHMHTHTHTHTPPPPPPISEALEVNWQWLMHTEIWMKSSQTDSSWCDYLALRAGHWRSNNFRAGLWQRRLSC